jgi:hypothetical protein
LSRWYFSVVSMSRGLTKSGTSLAAFDEHFSAQEL